MNQHDASFDYENMLMTFFTANNCMVEKRADKLTVELTEELDKSLMNRPFYWHYMEMTGQRGVPQKVTFQLRFDQLDPKAETIHAGSPWFQRIYKYLQAHATFIYCFENITTKEKTMLVPWLMINCIVTYQGIQQKETLYSLGLNLINGTLHLNMMQALKDIELVSVIPDFCYTISPIITLTSGYQRMEQYLLKKIESEQHEWAVIAGERLKEEIAMIHHFYDETSDTKEREKELKSAYERLQPKISLNVMNGGLIFLRNTFLQ